jgi:hypothetical protein
LVKQCATSALPASNAAEAASPKDARETSDTTPEICNQLHEPTWIRYGYKGIATL